MAKNILSVFWNYEQRRLRAFWRLGLHTALLVLLALFLAIPLGIAMILVARARGVDVSSLTSLGSTASVPFTVISTLVELAVLVGAAWLASWFLDRRRFADFGLHLGPSWWIDFGFGLALGGVLMSLIFAVEAAAGWVTITGTLQASPSDPGAALALPFGAGILLSVFRYVGVGISEEMLSRGYHLKNLAEGLNFRPFGPRGAIILAALLSSAVFGVLHAANPSASAISTFNIFLAGLFLASGYVLTGELAIPIGLHITWNFFQGNVFGFPVSGTQAGTTFIAVEQGGGDLVTGGAFGPEAGLIGIAAMILGSVLTVLWVRVRYGRASLWKDLATPELRRREQQSDDSQREGV